MYESAHFYAATARITLLLSVVLVAVFGLPDVSLRCSSRHEKTMPTSRRNSSIRKSLLNSFRGVRCHSAELTCVAVWTSLSHYPAAAGQYTVTFPCSLSLWCEPVWAKVRQRYFHDEACDLFCAVQALRLALTSLPLQGVTRHTFPEQHKVQHLHPQVIVRE